MEAFVLCAGMSSRARNKKQTLSKLLLNYNNQTLLDYHIEKLRRFKIKKIYFNVFFQKKKIINIIKKKIKNVDYKIINEKKLMGTCGALQSIKNKFKKKNLLIVYPDNVSDCNYSEMILFHKKIKSDLTIATYLESDTKNSGLISFDKKNKIKFFREKKKKFLKKKCGVMPEYIFCHLKLLRV
jgi:mannose-1-phosphate guanylyltransferase